ncbi:hypothetical protein [Paucibacter sp. KCTC 42545]|uniref:hypothetical protein n=1 Tax=Paucibacter sp. KCTC 42545 TaxID=1768242 RepID=UPI000733B6B4|nr:hypothetical protein [Paucibacter sp. KCTC 42545]ALT77381.1 hypothetical protein AT984_09435 [Paucibacter sp. KCTC 42545]
MSLALLSLLGASLHVGAAEPSAGAQKAAAKPAAKPTKAAKKAEVKAPVVVPLAEASAEQLEAAKRAYLGRYDCEFKQSIELEPHATAAGYVDVKYLKQVFTMKPVLSSTGALRLEDVTGRTLMIQIANKSMLLDTQVGQRIVDECLHPEQRTLIDLARAAAAAAAASGIDLSAVNGLGITPRVEKP